MVNVMISVHIKIKLEIGWLEDSVNCLAKPAIITVIYGMHVLYVYFDFKCFIIFFLN